MSHVSDREKKNPFGTSRQGDYLDLGQFEAASLNLGT